MLPIRLAMILILSSPALAANADFGRSCIEAGWEDRFDTIQHWRAEKWLVSAPDDQAVARREQQVGLFRVSAGRGMAWTRTVNPVWIGDFPWLEVEYTLESPANGATAMLALGDDSTGPVTPGATNPENPLASGGRTTIDLPTDQRRLVIDLRGRFQSDRVARISLLLKAGSSSAGLNVGRIAFLANDPRGKSEPTTTSTSAPPLLTAGEMTPAQTGAWQPITLPDEDTVAAGRLAQAFSASPAWPGPGEYRSGGVTFHLRPANQAAVGTSVAENGTIELRGEWRGSELALLLAARVFGNEAPWHGAASVQMRHSIRSPHELTVHLDYTDGTTASALPWSVAKQGWRVEQHPGVHSVALDPDKTLARIRLEDKMSYGQVFLLAASVNRSRQASLIPAPSGQILETACHDRPRSTATTVRREGNLLIIENAWLRLAASVQAGLHLKKLAIVPLNRTVVSETSPSTPLLDVLDAQGRPVQLMLREMKTNRHDASTLTELTWSVDDARSVQLRLDATDDGQLRLTPRLVNSGTADWQATVRCPQLGGCRIAENAADRWYLFATPIAIIDRRPIESENAYGGLSYPLQFMDLFARHAGGGIGLMVEDTEFVAKSFRLKQDDQETHASAIFPDINVKSGEQVALPTCVLFCHLGDWHEAFNRYRTMIRTLAGVPAGRCMADLFYCRRDYPLGGTDYLYNVRERHYTPDDLIQESSAGFGGIDMIDVSGWAYHEKTGRVGEYRTNDLGGLPVLREGAEIANRARVLMGLYFEGHLIDRRCDLAATALPAWQSIGRDGKPRWWSGEMEFFTCPGHPKWQKALSSAIADVAAETGVDAVYVDQFGLGSRGQSCWSAGHGHPVPSNILVAEHQMLSAVRNALDKRTPQTAIYIEQVPCDAMVPLVDGAFDRMMAFTNPRDHVTKLPLLRYAFPELAAIQMVTHGIRPIPATEDDLHRCIFHGEALWLKGRSDSWYSAGFRRTAARAYPVLHKHAATFRSPDCEPLVPTLLDEVYANRFTRPEEIVITVYNGGFREVSGDLLRTSLPQGWQVRDLWADTPGRFRREGERIVLAGRIPPRSVGVFLLRP